MARLAIIVALLIFFSVHSCYDVNGNPFKCPDSLSEKVKEIKDALVKLRTTVEEKYSQKCTSLQSTAESYSGCFSKLIDETEFSGECSETDSVVESAICGECKGSLKSNSKTTVETFASGDEVDQDVAFTTLFEDALKTAQGADKTTIISASLVLQSGVQRVFPGIHSHCDVSAAQREALLAAAHGQVNLIIMLDVSASMGFNQGWNTAVNYVHGLLSTVDSDSYVQLVYFNNECYSPIAKETIRGSVPNIANLRSTLCSKGKGGGTKFKNAFQFAFSRFKNSLSSGNATACETAMVIITDGDIKDIRGKLVNYVIDQVNDIRSKGVDFHVSAISLGNKRRQDRKTLRRIVCSCGGVLMEEDDGTNFTRQLYHHLLLFTRSRENYVNKDGSAKFISTVRWGYPFPYHNTNAITASLPLYVSKDSTQKKQYAGVVTLTLDYDKLLESADVVQKDGTVTADPNNALTSFDGIPALLAFLKDGYDETKEKSTFCPPFTMSAAELEDWRSAFGTHCAASATDREEAESFRATKGTSTTSAFPYLEPRAPSALYCTCSEVPNAKCKDKDSIYKPAKIYKNTDLLVDGNVPIEKSAENLCCSTGTEKCIGDGIDHVTKVIPEVAAMQEVCGSLSIVPKLIALFAVATAVIFLI